MPDLDKLQRSGWMVATTHGLYCVAWRHAVEAVFEWRHKDWYVVSRRNSG